QAGKGAYDAEMQADQAEVGAIEAELGAASELESSNDRITEEVAQALKDFIQAVIASLHDAQKAEANRRWFA
nr:hypothetical protein [Hyphomicrobiales bacterium]